VILPGLLRNARTHVEYYEIPLPGETRQMGVFRKPVNTSLDA
jgi:hypothetical protein